MKFILAAVFICLMSGQARALSVITPPDIDYTALHKAAEDCDIEKERSEMKALQPADRSKEINRLDREGYTPLSYAARYGCIKVVKLLVKSGALVDAHEERGGWKPLL